MVTNKGEVLEIHNPSELPEPQFIERIEEPIIEALILTPDRYLGPLLQLLDDRRGQQKRLEYISTNRVILDYLIPLNEVVYDFYNQLKSLSQGYASMDYELAGYREEPLVRLDILVNYEEVDALSVIVHKDKVYYVGRALVDRLRRAIPRQQFEVIIQAAVGKESLPGRLSNRLEKMFWPSSTVEIIPVR